MQKIFQRGGVLLTLSALISKFLGLWRDRLFLEIYPDPVLVDGIFASFRIPDFFFFLLIGGTVSTLLLPRIASLEKKEETAFFFSFLWLVVVFFGIVCLVGLLFTLPLVQIFAKGLPLDIQLQMIPLSRWLFGSVFLLAVSSVFGAYQQNKEHFIALSIAPILYTLSICLTLLLVRDQFGLSTIGIGAIMGALLHLMITTLGFFRQHKTVLFVWKKPLKSWKNFFSDFFFRVINNASFQINQSVDIIIASFLMAGSVTAFSLGTNLALAPMSIIGLTLANAAFPKLTHHKKNPETQKKVLFSTLQWIALFTIPATLIAIAFSDFWLTIIYNLSGEALIQTEKVFFWTVVSLPFACSIPVLSRVFLANDDTKTPLKITTISLAIATAVAVIFCFWVFPSHQAILGLAFGNLTANVLSAFLFGISLFRYFSTHDVRN